jgi:hypothetical protein
LKGYLIAVTLGKTPVSLEGLADSAGVRESSGWLSRTGAPKLGCLYCSIGTTRKEAAVKIKEVHSTLAAEEDNPKHHDQSECEHYKELVKNNHVAQGRGGYPKCITCQGL